MKTHLDLFSGIGGFALAAKWNGLATIGFSEIEPYACKILSLHWPEVPNLGDVRTMAGTPCDLLTGGFPCQPFSCAGKQRGKADDRHLWPHMLRVIKESHPTWVLGENVPGLIRMELDTVLSDLEGIGYSVWPVVIPACAVDAPHRRDRLWIVANTNRSLCNWRTDKPERGQEGRATPGWNGEDVAHRYGTGRQKQRWSVSAGEKYSPTEHGSTPLADANLHEQYGRSSHVQVGRGGSQGQAEKNGDAGSAQWCPEPELGRVAHGIPHRSHRLKGLGNSIVPQVAAQLIGMMIQSEREL